MASITEAYAASKVLITLQLVQVLDCSCHVTQTTGDAEATHSKAQSEEADKPQQQQQQHSSEPEASGSGTGGMEGTAAPGQLQPVQEVAVMQLSSDLSSCPPPTAQVLLHATLE